jgi:acetoacetyl-CoA synthetase
MSDAPLWSPSPDRIRRANLSRFSKGILYQDLYEWSVAKPAEFWDRMWDFGEVIGDRGARTVVDLDRMPGATFFPDARINFTENVLREDGDGDAIVFRSESGGTRTLSWRTVRS